MSRWLEVLIEIVTDCYVWFARKRLPVCWGNVKWYRFQAAIYPGRAISRKHKEWIDYKTLPNGETAFYLTEKYEHRNLRKQLNDLVIEVLLGSVSPPQSERPICIFTSGGTASGKTSAINAALGEDAAGFLRIDYDRVKRVLPEYPLMLDLRIQGAASYVQSESIKIGGRLFKKGYARRLNIVYEKTLEDSTRAIQDIRELKKKGYETVIIGTYITREEGHRRAEVRYRDKGRYVPADRINHGYNNVPQALFDLRHKVDQIYLFDNNGPGLRLMFSKDETGGRIVHDHGLYGAYLSYVGAQCDLTK